jgi:VanZ family protein
LGGRTSHLLQPAYSGLVAGGDRHMPKELPGPGLTSSRAPLVLWLATTIFIVYGTSIPFHFVSDLHTVHANLARVTINPLISPETGRRVSIPDFASNILLFLPFGCFGVWLFGRSRRSSVRVVLLVIVSAVLSASVETMQLFTTDRTSSVADVLANTIGGSIGAVGGVFLSATAGTFGRGLVDAGLAESAVLYPFLVATLVLVAAVWEPFDVTLDVGSVVPKVRAFVHDPLQLGPWGDELLSFLEHLLFTSTLFLWLAEVRVRSSALVALVTGVAVAVFAEGMQLFIDSRMPGVWDAAVGTAGALAGVPVARAFSAGWLRPPFWCGALVALTAMGVAMQQLSPFTAFGAEQPFQWAPFLNYYEFTTFQTISHAAELLLSYVPLGFAVAIAARTPASRRIAVAGIALVIAATVEYLQKFIGARFPDVTDVAISIGGAWLGAWTATVGWRLFDAEMAVLRALHSPGGPSPHYS